MASIPNLQILHVEDDEDYLVLMEDLLSEAKISDFEVTPATTYEKAFDLLTHNRYDLCFLDYRLGACNGLDLLKNLGATNNNTPIIMITNYDSAALDMTAEKLGAKFFIPKDQLDSKSVGRAIRYVLSHNQSELALREMATKDELTGLLNRRSFLERLESLISHYLRGCGEFSLVFIDLDNFKEINDTYGHEAGDIVLRNVGERLNTTIRNNDIAGRLGGDEFVIVFDGMSEDTLNLKFNEIAEQVFADIKIGNTTLEIFASWGSSHFPRDGSDPTTLLSCADTKMYQHKKIANPPNKN